jgi:hypothetical protein
MLIVVQLTNKFPAFFMHVEKLITPYIWTLAFTKWFQLAAPHFHAPISLRCMLMLS